MRHKSGRKSFQNRPAKTSGDFVATRVEEGSGEGKGGKTFRFPVISELMSAQTQPAGSILTREQILAALRALSAELGKQGATGEICLFGGTVKVLAFTARLTTKDVDAIFQPTQ